MERVEGMDLIEADLRMLGEAVRGTLDEKLFSPFKKRKFLNRSLKPALYGDPNPRKLRKGADAETCVSAGKYKQRCTDGEGNTRLVDMTAYYNSGRKANYAAKKAKYDAKLAKRAEKKRSGEWSRGQAPGKGNKKVAS